MDTPPQSGERRHFHRIEFTSPAVLRTPHGPVNVQLVDLSLKGALVEIETPKLLPQVGDNCSLSLPLSEGIEIVMEARVARVDGVLTGLHCEHIDLESIQHLRRLVELNLGDEDLLQRDLNALFETER